VPVVPDLGGAMIRPQFVNCEGFLLLAQRSTLSPLVGSRQLVIGGWTIGSAGGQPVIRKCKDFAKVRKRHQNCNVSGLSLAFPYGSTGCAARARR